MGFMFDPKPVAFLILYIIIILLFYFLHIRKKGYSFFQVCISFFFIAYLICVFKETMLPIQFFKEDLSQYDYRYYQLIPFKTILDVVSAHTWKMQIIGNILLLLPLPFFISIFKKGNLRLSKALIYTLITSIGIEIVQLLINVITRVPNKVADVDDILLNTLGGLIGWLIYYIISKHRFYKINVMKQLNTGQS